MTTPGENWVTFDICQITGCGVPCQVIAPALTPRRPGQRIKTALRISAGRWVVATALWVLLPVMPGLAQAPPAQGSATLARTVQVALTTASEATPDAPQFKVLICRKRFLEVRADVADHVDLSDDAQARIILEKAARFGRENCPSEKGFSNIVAVIVQPGNPHGKECFVFSTPKPTCVVRARNYRADAFTWQEYSNYPLQARKTEEATRKREEERRLAKERRAAEEERRRQEQEQRLARIEAERKERKARFDEFAQRHRVQVWVRSRELVANPFVFKGKTIGTVLRFEQMMSETQGLFEGEGGVVVVSGLPSGFVRAPGPCVIVARTAGITEARVPVLGVVSAPRLSFVAGYVCKTFNCVEFLPE